MPITIRNQTIVGDVHHHYDPSSKSWRVYYLKTDGKYSSSLLVSKDLYSFEARELTHKATPRAPYFVVAPLQYRAYLYSWYGQQYTHVCSRSRDGINWWAYPAYDIAVDRDVSGRGERDPFVFYDPDGKCHYMVALSYPNESNDCAIVLRKSIGSAPTAWEKKATPIVKFHNGGTWADGEPECPQMVKIDTRWYLIASLAHKTIHHVGPLSYWIGDEGKSPDEVDWLNKQRHELTSEDLCAAQVALRKNKVFALGWIPFEATGSRWGGHMNAPLLINSGAKGALKTTFDPKFVARFSNQISGDVIDSGNPVLLSMDMSFVGERACLTFAAADKEPIHIIIDACENTIMASYGNTHIRLAAISSPNKVKKDKISLMMLIDKDMLEANLNKAVTLHARLPRPLVGDYLWHSGVNMRHLSIQGMKE